MTGPKDSESTETEARIQKAIQAMKKDSKHTLRKAARDFNVPRSMSTAKKHATKPTKTL
jgi:hypothetical protein